MIYVLAAAAVTPIGVAFDRWRRRCHRPPYSSHRRALAELARLNQKGPPCP